MTHRNNPQIDRTAYGWCAWHRDYAEGVRLIEVHERVSGGGGDRFACPPCRQAHRLVPYEDQS